MIRVLENRRAERDDAGFTLIELMVVVLIIAILIAIAIPTFLGARERSQNRAAQSSLRNGVTAAKTIFTDNEDYTDASAAALNAVEPSLTFQAVASAGPKEVFVSTPDADTVIMSAQSKSGDCYWIRDVATSGTEFNVEASTTCTTTVPAAGWDPDGW